MFQRLFSYICVLTLAIGLGLGEAHARKASEWGPSSAIQTTDSLLAVRAGANVTVNVGSAATQASSAFQPASAKLTAIDGLTYAANKCIKLGAGNSASTVDCTTIGLALLAAADAPAERTALGLVIGTDVQAFNARLTDVSGLATTDNGVVIGNGTNLVLESGATLKTSLGLTIGTNVEAWDAQLDDVAGLTPTDNAVVIGNGTNFVTESGATLKTSLGLTIGTNVEAWDADLDSWAAKTAPSGTAVGTTDTQNLTNKTYNGVTITAPAGSATLGLADGSTLATSGANSVTLTTTGATNVTFPTSGTLLTAGTLTYCLGPFSLTTPDGAAVAATNVDSFTMRHAFTVTAVYLSARTVATGATKLAVDINEAGVSILSTTLTLDASETDSTTAATAAVISDSSLASGSVISFDIDAVGNTTPGAGIKVNICGHQ